MGKYKQSLGDIDISSNTGTNEPDMPNPIDPLVNNILRDCRYLSGQFPYGYEEELEEMIDILNVTLNQIRKPF